MDQHRITMSDIVIGEALPWDVFDASGHLLLSRGYVVERAQQVQALVERGLFVDAKSIEKKQQPKPAKVQELPSVLRLINLANKRLERLLFNLANDPDETKNLAAQYPKKVKQMTMLLQKAGAIHASND